MSESLINHPKSAPGDERGKTGDKGYLYDYVHINHSRGVGWRGERDAGAIASSIWLQIPH